MISIQIIPIVGAVLFGIIMVMTALNAMGLPLGEFTMGGQHRILPRNMRILAWISLVGQFIGMMVLLQTGYVISPWISIKVIRGICFFFAVYLSLNSVMNFLSRSMKEKMFITPVSIIVAICCWITAICTASMADMYIEGKKHFKIEDKVFR